MRNLILYQTAQDKINKFHCLDIIDYDIEDYRECYPDNNILYNWNNIPETFVLEELELIGILSGIAFWENEDTSNMKQTHGSYYNTDFATIINVVNNSLKAALNLSLDSYATEERSERRSGSGGTQEFFTPHRLVTKMCNKLSKDTWTDFSKTILEPSAGNYNFVCYCAYLRLLNCKTQQDCESALSTIYSVELMLDNVLEGKSRLYKLIKTFGYKVTDTLKEIIDHNNVCSNFFDWDYENWCPIKESKCEALF